MFTTLSASAHRSSTIGKGETHPPPHRIFTVSSSVSVILDEEIRERTQAGRTMTCGRLLRVVLERGLLFGIIAPYISVGDAMQIVCTTTDAAAEVLQLLLIAGMGLRRDFTLHPVMDITPPITFTLLVTLDAALLAEIRAVPDTTVTP